MKKEYLSVGEFSRITRTSISTLRHYDKIGLLTPAFRRTNNYRCYSVKQLAFCNAIRLLKKLGVPLAEIRGLKDRRTPELAKQILLRQIKTHEDKKDELDEANKLLNTMLNVIQSGLDADKDNISIRYLPKEHIILGELNDYSDENTDYDALYYFYNTMSVKYAASEYEMQYPVWATHAEDRVKIGDWKYPDRYYFFNPAGQDCRPAGLYAIGYTFGGYGENTDLGKRMKEFIDLSGFEICGDAYEEYPLNEICTNDDGNYLIRVMITVREKQQTPVRVQ